MVESTLSETVLWSALRALFTATLAMLPLLLLQHVWQGLSQGRWKLLAALAAGLPFFIPELLTGFNYRVQATVWAAKLAPNLNAVFTEALYGGIQLLRAVAAGALILLILPRDPATGSGVGTWKLLKPLMNSREWLSGLLRLRLQGDLAGLIAAWCVMSLVVFQEFETAALMQIDRHPLAWSVWMFDAHAARQPLTDSLQMAIGPLLIECLLLSPAAIVIWLRQESAGRELVSAAGEHRPARTLKFAVAALWALLGFTVLVAIPMLRMSREAVDGVRMLLVTPRLLTQSLEQILTSTLISFGAAVAAISFCGLLLGLIDRNRNRPSPAALATLVIALLPGLAGPLIIGLTLLAAFQLPILLPLYDTWLPLLLGLTLSVLPKALALQLLLRLTRTNEAIFLADLLRVSHCSAVRRAGARILWRLTDVRWICALLLLTQWCFWDVTTTSILRPLTPEPVVTRLYNEMHFARTEALLGLTVLAGLSPLVLGLAGMLAMLVVRTKKDTKQSFVS
jgi:hypothetical protein